MTTRNATKLYAVTKGPGDLRVYCGPAAISAITGKPVRGYLREMINARRGRDGNKPVRGMFAHEVSSVLGKLGFQLIQVHACCRGKTLRQFVVDNWQGDKDPIFLVNLTGHYVVTRGRFVIDNWELDGCDVDEHHSRKTRVKGVYLVRVVE